MIRYSDKNPLGEERLYLADISRSQLIIEGNQGRGPKEGLLESLHRITSDERTHFMVRETRQEPWRILLTWYQAGPCLVFFPKEFRTICLENGVAHSRLGFPYISYQ